MKQPGPVPTLSHEDVRKLTITALFSDDLLFDQLALKGGNAMSLVHGISSRASLDLDFSMEGDFDNLPDVQDRIERALAARFAPFGFVPFDLKLLPKPSSPREDSPPSWGGYRLEFKIADEGRYRTLGAQKPRLRRESLVVGPQQMKVFLVDFSKWEYTAGKTRAEFDDYTIYVYTPAMIALEKVRAICQQMDDYALTGRTRRARARDFYDIFTIVANTSFRFDSPDALALIRLIFQAKDVPLALISKVRDQREYHRPDWPAVRNAVAGPLEPFDYYFDFVVRQIEPLHALGVE
jgi:hypothetical protein